MKITFVNKDPVAMRNVIFSTILLWVLTSCADSSMDFSELHAVSIIGTWKNTENGTIITFDGHQNYIIRYDGPDGFAINLKYQLDPAESSNKLYIEGLACTYALIDHDQLKLTLRHDPSFSGPQESAVYYRIP